MKQKNMRISKLVVSTILITKSSRCLFPHQLYRRAQVLQAKCVTEFTATRLVCLDGWNAVNQKNKIHAAFLQGSGGFPWSFWCGVPVCVWFYMTLLELQGAEWSFCHHRWTGKARGASEKPWAMQFAYCVCACVYVCGICVLYSSVCVQVCVCHNSVADRSSTTPSHATNAIPVCLGCPPNHQISLTNKHINTYKLTHMHSHTHSHTLPHTQYGHTATNISETRCLQRKRICCQRGNFSFQGHNDGLPLTRVHHHGNLC